MCDTCACVCACVCVCGGAHVGPGAQFVLAFQPRTVGRRGAVSLPPLTRTAADDAAQDYHHAGDPPSPADDVRPGSSINAVLQLAQASPFCMARDALSRRHSYSATAASARVGVLFLRLQHIGRLYHGDTVEQLR